METLRKSDDDDDDDDDTRPNITAQPRRVAVQFIDDFELPYEVGAEKYFSADWKRRWEKLSARFPGITLKPIFTAVSPARLKELVALAMQRDPTYQPPNFLTFFAIDFSSLRPARNFARALSRWKIVKHVYVESRPLLPTTQPQRYVENPTASSPEARPFGDIGGIGAAYAWELPGGDGSGISFVDIEKGWRLDHPDLRDQNGQLKVAGPLGGSFNYGIKRPPSPPNGNPYDYSETQHGTNVLGILVTNLNPADPIGWKGIAYGASGSVVSPWTGDPPDPPSDGISGKLILPEGVLAETTTYQQPREWNIANAVLIAITRLSFGYVILLEVQAECPADSKSCWPIEIEIANFQIIRLATALGIIVVEAAGNGIQPNGPGNNLNNLKDTLKDNFSNLIDLNEEDSGAIIVGAAVPTALFGNAGSRTDNSNFGARVDCFAWGNTVGSLDVNSDTGEPTQAHATNFSGTSAAAAIVAGAAIVIQGIEQRDSSLAGATFRFSAFQMRNILRDRSLINGVSINTPSTNPETDLIGVMPNLQRIIENTLRIVPEVVILDFKDDPGDPHNRELSSLDSPDVSVAAHGELDREVSVRVFNRGGAPATDVQATVYWTTTDLLGPHQLTMIGTSSAVTVPMGTSPKTDLPKILWPASTNIGNYWLIVTVGCPGDPAPELPQEFSTTELLALIQSNNNITLKKQEQGPILV